VAIKTNRPSLSTEEQNSEYLFHFTYMLIPPSLLNALHLSNKDLIYVPLDFECSNSYKLMVFHGGIYSSNYCSSQVLKLLGFVGH
jgi:hypothetical protein